MERMREGHEGGLEKAMERFRRRQIKRIRRRQWRG